VYQLSTRIVSRGNTFTKFTNRIWPLFRLVLYERQRNQQTSQSRAQVGNKTAFQSKADHAQTGYTDILYCFCDLDLNPMTLIYESSLDIPKMYVHTHATNERSKSRHSRGRIGFFCPCDLFPCDPIIVIYKLNLDQKWTFYSVSQKSSPPP